jgi:segregation and condensation protein B
MAIQEFKSVIESLIFASPSPLAADKICEVLEDEMITPEAIESLVNELNEEYGASNRGFKIYKIAGGFEYRSNPEHGMYLTRLFNIKKSFKLSKSSLETLAVIAYNQPVTRIEIEMIRSVSVPHVLNKLLELELIKVVGERDTPGRPLLYGSTSKFLEYFGLNSLDDLPEISEIEKLIQS